MIGLISVFFKIGCGLFAFLIIGAFYIAATSALIVVIGETRGLYGLEVGLALALMLYLFVVAYAWMVWLALKGRTKWLRRLALGLTPLAVLAVAMAPLGALVLFLSALLQLGPI